MLKGLGPGGAERLVLNQLLTTAGGIDYAVLRVLPQKNHLVDDIIETGATVAIIDGLSTFQDNGIAPRALRSSLEKLQPDIVHVHSPVLAAQVRLLARANLLSAKVVTTEHNRWPRHHKITRLLNRATAQADDARFAVSNDVLAGMDKRLHDSTVVLEHGIPVEPIQQLRSQRSAVRSELGLAPDHCVIGIVANFRPEKRYEVFFDAALKALAMDATLRFVVIGQGPGEAVFRDMVSASNKRDAFNVLGYRADATRLMAAFDVFTLSSGHEGKPVALMEAMAMGLPTVATRAGGIPEMVIDGESGRLAEIDDSHALARNYVELSANLLERSSLGANAATQALARFDASRSTKSIESTYHGLTSATG